MKGGQPIRLLEGSHPAKGHYDFNEHNKTQATSSVYWANHKLLFEFRETLDVVTWRQQEGSIDTKLLPQKNAYSVFFSPKESKEEKGPKGGTNLKQALTAKQDYGCSNKDYNAMLRAYE